MKTVTWKAMSRFQLIGVCSPAGQQAFADYSSFGIPVIEEK